MRRINPFIKYLGKEDHLQHQLYDYYLYTYRNKAMFWHTPNEGRRTPFERFKVKYLGMIAGVSDIIMVKNGDVLFLELKVGKNKPTENQKTFLKNTKAFGFTSEVAWTFEEGKKIIDEFMGELNERIS